MEVSYARIMEMLQDNMTWLEIVQMLRAVRARPLPSRPRFIAFALLYRRGVFTWEDCYAEIDVMAFCQARMQVICLWTHVAGWLQKD